MIRKGCSMIYRYRCHSPAIYAQDPTSSFWTPYSQNSITRASPPLPPSHTPPQPSHPTHHHSPRQFSRTPYVNHALSLHCSAHYYTGSLYDPTLTGRCNHPAPPLTITYALVRLIFRTGRGVVFYQVTCRGRTFIFGRRRYLNLIGKCVQLPRLSHLIIACSPNTSIQSQATCALVYSPIVPPPASPPPPLP